MWAVTLLLFLLLHLLLIAFIAGRLLARLWVRLRRSRSIRSRSRSVSATRIKGG